MKEPYIALYRKYRPKSFAEVVGQDSAVNLLQGAIKQKKISHAYLFSGGRGTGKTTVARIVARDIGCNDEDIIEIDAASNRGIEEIRELREAVRTAPFSSPYKVYILDEAHMLTKEAANALLKTLEEPPAHIVFILATTDPSKLPQTILSRTQHVHFNEPDVTTLTKQVLHVAKEEGITISQESAELIARHGKGSYRDALGMLEQAMSISGKEIKQESLASFLGEPQGRVLVAIVEALCEKNTKGIVEGIRSLREEGVDAVRAYDELILCVKYSLFVRVGEKVHLSDKELVQTYERLGKEYPHTIASKTLLELLRQRHLLLVSPLHAYTAMSAILLSFVEGE
jgi:DNA polymerase-3 subunit gamma/tau